MPQGERIEASVEEYCQDLREIWRNLERPQDRARAIWDDDHLAISHVDAPLTIGNPPPPTLWEGIAPLANTKPKKNTFRAITDCDCKSVEECEFDGNEAQLCFDIKE